MVVYLMFIATSCVHGCMYVCNVRLCLYVCVISNQRDAFDSNSSVGHVNLIVIAIVFAFPCTQFLTL